MQASYVFKITHQRGRKHPDFRTVAHEFFSLSQQSPCSRRKRVRPSNFKAPGPAPRPQQRHNCRIHPHLHISWTSQLVTFSKHCLWCINHLFQVSPQAHHRLFASCRVHSRYDVDGRRDFQQTTLRHSSCGQSSAAPHTPTHGCHHDNASLQVTVSYSLSFS